MTPPRILHVDDDPEASEIVRSSLHHHAGLSITYCPNAKDALAMAISLAPHLIIFDVSAPGEESLLERILENSDTEDIPVIVTTIHDRPAEQKRLTSLGAAAVITKPFDSPILAQAVRSHLRLSGLAAANRNFAIRLREDTATLAIFRDALQSGSESPAIWENLFSCVHKLAGAAGVFGFQAVSDAASTLEEAIVERRAGRGPTGSVQAQLDALLACMPPASTDNVCGRAP